jgi:hypothetical protein
VGGALVALAARVVDVDPLLVLTVVVLMGCGVMVLVLVDGWRD